MIRQLKPGDPVPPGEARRYPSSHGYVRLRWYVARGEYVEVYEHRVVAGVVTDAEHVHHVNGQKADNRPENLQPIDAATHIRTHHGTDERFSRYEVDYLAGLTTSQIAEKHRTHPGNVSRALARLGVAIRPRRRRVVDLAELAELHAKGMRVPFLADRYGETTTVIRANLRRIGLTPHRPGRPPTRVAAAAKELTR